MCPNWGPDVDDLWVIRPDGMKIALEVRGTQCEVTCQTAKLMFKISEFLLNVAWS
jgi:hypothetical protein